MKSQKNKKPLSKLNQKKISIQTIATDELYWDKHRLNSKIFIKINLNIKIIRRISEYSSHLT